jgi:hypothetical protein
METDDVGMFDRLTVSADSESIKVLDNTQAVTAKRKIVGAVSGTSIAKVKGLLALVAGTGIGIGHRHLADAHTVHDASSIVVDIVQNSSFAAVEGYPEAPLLPLDQ